MSPLCGYFFAKQPFFLPSCQSNDKFGNFFSNFQGFTLVPWQKVGRIWLVFAGNHSNCPISPLFACISVKFFPSPSPYSNDMAPKWKFQIFPLWFGVLSPSFFIQALQNATFGVKNTAVAQKLSKLAIFHLFSRDFFFLSFPVFERYDTEIKKPEKTPIFMPLLTKIS